MEASHSQQDVQSFIAGTLWGDASHALRRLHLRDGLFCNVENTARFGETLI
jgi:hypothetical protein